MVKNRSVATVVILSIVTCGIYNIYWMWCAINELDSAGKKSNMDPIIQFILLFFYVGYIVFALNASENINSIREQKGLPPKDDKVLWIILSIIFPLAEIALVQSAMNEVADN